ncbi:MAG: efflux RND transporter periplasmic adaptor subunit [Candidatus Eremiobacteraeota bacterium]|nr:efflux RND transporter periplasmic adaptor subunit [Candidatus Eremiobacteraeota bacterium]
MAVTTAEENTLHPAQTLPGLIAPYQSVAIQSNLTEPTDEVNVAEGDRVTKGEVLARLDTADLRARLAADTATAASDAANTTHTVYQGGLTIVQNEQSVRSSQAAVRQAQETLRKDEVDLARYQQLVASGYISQQQAATQVALVANDRQAVRSAQSTLASAQEQVNANGTLATSGLQSSTVEQARATQQVALANADQVRTQIAKAVIVSPIDGVVVNRNLNVGEYPGTRQIFTLQQTDPIYAIVRGSGAQIADIEPGAAATVIASDLSKTKLSGTVVAVLNQINPGSTDFQVKVKLSNAGNRLRAGMSVVGSVSMPAARGITVPATAFIDDNHDSVLVVGKNDTVRTVRVVETIGDGKNSIVQGLPSGTRVVSDGQSSVGDGQKVAVR